jgi:hypothetical protein
VSHINLSPFLNSTLFSLFSQSTCSPIVFILYKYIYIYIYHRRQVESNLLTEKRSVELKESIAGEEASKEVKLVLVEMEKIKQRMMQEEDEHLKSMQELKGSQQSTLEQMHNRVKSLVVIYLKYVIYIYITHICLQTEREGKNMCAYICVRLKIISKNPEANFSFQNFKIS